MKKISTVILLLLHLALFCQHQLDIRFYNESVNREMFIYADNNEVIPVSAKFDFKLTNLRSSLPSEKIVVIPPSSHKFLIAKLTPIVLNAANKMAYSNTFNFGDVLQESYDEDYVYSLPYASGRTQRIYQGYNGKFSHQGEYALDFDLKVGDPVLAVREGTVIETVDSHTQGCPYQSCHQYNNRILIAHSDGTFADYSHLKYKGSAVRKGDTVKKGQLIGYSGNTGFSSGPHLHFAVFLNRLDGNRKSIKTLFRTSKGDVFLDEGKSYTRNDK